ncbi:hypothetical protein M885DRAFT_144908 [Pelagophyceae sp. CCMP2097]|nr:hypothetical protein M885DRAFT_144908 [Pelagophyceae sp. CCMP2097]
MPSLRHRLQRKDALLQGQRGTRGQRARAQDAKERRPRTLRRCDHSRGRHRRGLRRGETLERRSWSARRHGPMPSFAVDSPGRPRLVNSAANRFDENMASDFANRPSYADLLQPAQQQRSEKWRRMSSAGVPKARGLGDLASFQVTDDVVALFLALPLLPIVGLAFVIATRR